MALVPLTLGLLVSVFALSLALSPVSAAGGDDALYLVVSCSGFRQDYLDLMRHHGQETPNFARILSSGVVSHLTPAFPPSTWPAHWTLATGMHAETHGVLADTFYDYREGELYAASPEAKWYTNGSHGGGEPVWVTAENAGLRAGGAAWPASSTPIEGVLPSYSLGQDKDIPMEARVDAAISWFTQEKEPARLVLLYLDEPGTTGREHGVPSPQLLDAIARVDKVMGYLLDQLAEKKLADRMNLMVVSDHGLADIVATIPLDDYVDPALYTPPVSGDATARMFRATEGNEAALAAALRTVPHSHYYTKAELPREMFYSYNERILSHHLLSDVGYRTCCFNGSEPSLTVAEPIYSSSEPDMGPIFLATGPAFKSNYAAPGLNSTDLYPLLCYLMGLQPHPNDGSLHTITQILKDDTAAKSFMAKMKAAVNTETVVTFSKSIAGLILMLGLGGFVTLVYFTVYKKGQYRARSRVPADLAVQVPIQHPHFALEERNDSTWLLNQEHESEEEEEWTPISISPPGIMQRDDALTETQTL